MSGVLASLIQTIALAAIACGMIVFIVRIKTLARSDASGAKFSHRADRQDERIAAMEERINNLETLVLEQEKRSKFEKEL